MIDLRILKRPLITEKMSKLAEFSEFAFEVDKTANKLQIRSAIEKKFEVKVISIRTILIRGKMRRYGRFVGKRPDWKKAIVTLQKGQTIELFEHAS